ncbi:DUF3817 domain-containing protein [bacterium]|nr:DUF3817 domain-containing protein [bacterium]
MLDLIKTSIGRLRIMGFLEGVSLIILVFVGMPLKYMNDDPSLVKTMGPIHGALFLIYIFVVFSTAPDYKWKFTKTTWKLLFASIVPFGNFYVDAKILKPEAENQTA